MAWNFADIFDAIAEVSNEEHPACIHAGPGGSSGITISWPELMRRSNRLARYLAAQGLRPDSKVAHYMRNCPAYIETMVASFKGRYVHVNVNYRYRDNELHYILDNSDAEAVVYGAEFREHVAALRPRLDLLYFIGFWCRSPAQPVSRRSDGIAVTGCKTVFQRPDMRCASRFGPQRSAAKAWSSIGMAASRPAVDSLRHA